MSYEIKLDIFEGPLDLLLHLCQKHELDILDIPIAFVTEKYLEYLAVMQLLDLDLASEYLVMAATLAAKARIAQASRAISGKAASALAVQAGPSNWRARGRSSSSSATTGAPTSPGCSRCSTPRCWTSSSS